MLVGQLRVCSDRNDVGRTAGYVGW